MNTNIEKLSDFIFFTEKGYEIPTEKTYTVQWEIIPHELVINNFISNPKGHFMFDINGDKTINTVIDEAGKIINNNLNITGPVDASSGLSETISIDNKNIILFNHTFNYYKKPANVFGKFFNGKYISTNETYYNKVKLTFTTLTDTYEKEYPIDYIFENIDTSINYINTNENSEDRIEYMSLNSVTITEMEQDDSNKNNYKNTVEAIIDSNFEYDELFPGVRYNCVIKQDKVSTDFIATNTIIILDSEYNVPNLNTSDYKLRFEFLKNSEMKFISSDTIANIIWNDYFEYNFDSNSLYFSVGFLTDIEGCYQNIMVMYIIINDKKYILGLFTFLTEVEGEDERYRALLGNMGIPDPIKYPNIFKSQDPMEEGIDWTLINSKSKELMINYDNIFPYSGTYKALLGAVKFLGYQDLIFKEWYKIKDYNNKDKQVAILTYDLLKGESLKTKLKQFGVSFGEFERYRKLNKLSMVYHLNEIDDDNIEVITYHSDKETEDKVLRIPSTYKLYEYRTDEILAKLYSVKNWLEKYILGVNCYISDICGEYIVLERIKTLTYVTLHYINDFTVTGKITPKVKEVSEFKNSSSNITCTLTEFDSISFEDYDDIPIEYFIKEIYTAEDGSTYYVSPPLETLVVADEFQFTLTNNEINSGTLAEFTDEQYKTNPILIQDNKILFFDDKQNLSKIDKKELPIIEISQGNLHFSEGNWRSNIGYSINVNIDENTGISYYTLYDETNENLLYKGNQKISLVPTSNSELIYTSNNKWNIPMFIMKNYKLSNNNTEFNDDFILEIIKGRMLFRNKNSEIKYDGKANGCEIIFELEFESKEQPIYVNYTYISDRIPIYTFDKNTLTVTTNKNIIINVNRLGTYSISVNAYDGYNNIFVNKSDDMYTVSSKPIDIDIVLNTKYISNKKDFYEYNVNGELITDNQTLFNKLDNEPIQPLNFRIYDIDTELSNENKFSYDSISYAMETPKPGNFVIFNNFTEKVTDISLIDTSTYKITLMKENPNHEIILFSSHLGLCFYNNIEKDILSDFYPLEVKETALNENYITVLFDSSTIINTEYNLGNYISAYVYSANEYILDKDTDISIDYDNNETIIYDVSPHYVKSLVIKICYTTETEIHNNYTNNVIDNETAYRIKDVSYNNDINKYRYILDGIVDLYKLNNKLYHNKAEHEIDSSIGILNTSNNYKLKICPVHLKAAQYVLRIDEFAEESAYSYNNSAVLRTDVKYNATPLFLLNYIDTTYSAYISDYDPYLLHDIWFNPINVFDNNTLLYKYKNIPITVLKNRNIILLPDESQDILNNEIPLRIHWNWKSYLIDDIDNYKISLYNENLYSKQVVFKSANKVLSIKPKLLGSQSPNMECCDVYGNRLLNEGDGLLYIDSSEKQIELPKHNEYIYYKDVYIVGFEEKFEPLNILSTYGDEVTYVLSNELSSNKNSNTNAVKYSYKIYYNDGTVKENEGADINIISLNDKKVKNNKAKFKTGKSTLLHKSDIAKLTCQVNIKKPHLRDLVKTNRNISLDIKQYGTSITTKIYNLTFNVNVFPHEGISDLDVYTLGKYIKNIKYNVIRSGGEIETIQYDTIEKSMLKIVDFSIIHNQYGNINYIPVNNGTKQNIGLLQITVLFVVNGIKEIITTSGLTFIYQY